MRHRPDAVMLFAAGLGTRMGALTQARPKPLIEVNGRPLIDHALDRIEAAHPSKIVVNAHYKSEMIVEHLAGHDAQVIIEAPDVLDTGGGLRNALSSLGAQPVITMNSDAIWRGPEPLPLLQDAWDPDRMDALLLCIPAAQAVAHESEGDFTLQDGGRIIRGPGHVYSGTQIIKTTRLHDIPDKVFSLNVLWNLMAEDGRLFGLSYPGHWCDVGHPEGITQAENLLAGHV